jgi:hypothetical protein
VNLVALRFCGQKNPTYLKSMTSGRKSLKTHLQLLKISLTEQIALYIEQYPGSHQKHRTRGNCRYIRPLDIYKRKGGYYLAGPGKSLEVCNKGRNAYFFPRSIFSIVFIIALSWGVAPTLSYTQQRPWRLNPVFHIVEQFLKSHDNF